LNRVQQDDANIRTVAIYVNHPTSSGLFSAWPAMA
jgi:hypothetical protein